VGVAAANIAHSNIVLTGLAGLVAGAMSMACGEYGASWKRTLPENGTN
jgi:vacuolar iron transporter family protein